MTKQPTSPIKAQKAGPASAKKDWTNDSLVKISLAMMVVAMGMFAISHMKIVGKTSEVMPRHQNTSQHLAGAPDHVTSTTAAGNNLLREAKGVIAAGKYMMNNITLDVSTQLNGQLALAGEQSKAASFPLSKNKPATATVDDLQLVARTKGLIAASKYASQLTTKIMMNDSLVREIALADKQAEIARRNQINAQQVAALAAKHAAELAQKSPHVVKKPVVNPLTRPLSAEDISMVRHARSLLQTGRFIARGTQENIDSFLQQEISAADKGLRRHNRRKQVAIRIAELARKHELMLARQHAAELAAKRARLAALKARLHLNHIKNPSHGEAMSHKTEDKLVLARRAKTLLKAGETVTAKAQTSLQNFIQTKMEDAHLAEQNAARIQSSMMHIAQIAKQHEDELAAQKAAVKAEQQAKVADEQAKWAQHHAAELAARLRAAELAAEQRLAERRAAELRAQLEAAKEAAAKRAADQRAAMLATEKQTAQLEIAQRAAQRRAAELKALVEGREYVATATEPAKIASAGANITKTDDEIKLQTKKRILAKNKLSVASKVLRKAHKKPSIPKRGKRASKHSSKTHSLPTLSFNDPDQLDSFQDLGEMQPINEDFQFEDNIQEVFAKEDKAPSKPKLHRAKPSAQRTRHAKASAPKLAKVAHYTLQLASFHDPKKLDHIMEYYQVPPGAVKRKVMQGGKVRYLLTYGDFAKPTLAKAELKQLPLGVQALKPWVRDMATLKADQKKIG